MINSAVYIRSETYRESVFSTCEGDRPLVAQVGRPGAGEKRMRGASRLPLPCRCLARLRSLFRPNGAWPRFAPRP